MRPINVREVIRSVAAVLVLGTLAGNAMADQAGQKQVTLDSLLNEMVDRSALSKTCNPSYLAKAATSYDRKSRPNENKKGGIRGHDWFANGDYGQCIRQENNEGRTESVLMEHHGPGTIVRWWAPARNSGMIRIYLDDSPTPVIAMTPDEWVGGNKLVSYPFSFHTPPTIKQDRSGGAAISTCRFPIRKVAR
jgi:hypothetical protein